MSRIQKPPTWKDRATHGGDQFFDTYEQFGAVDEKGRYFHWDDFRYRVPKGVAPEDAWAATKLHRIAQQKKLPLVADNQQPFTYLIIDSMQPILHLLDGLRNPILQNGLGIGGTSTQNNQFLVQSLVMEEAIASAQLEGAATTRQIAKAMLAEERAPRDESERMIVNNFLLMKSAKARKDEPLSIELIRELHRVTVRETADIDVVPGEIRQTDHVYVGDGAGGVAHQPPTAASLIERLQKLCDFANDDHDGSEGRPFIHPIIKAIILHFMMGYEHPFVDGNGRTARALFYWYLLKVGYWPFEFISISTLLKEAPTAYGKAYLYCETDDYDLTYFIDYQLRITRRAVDAFLAYRDRKEREYYDTMAWLNQRGLINTLNFRQGQLLSKVLRHPGRVFHTREVKNEFGISENTARADLEKLVELNVLAASKQGKTIRYVALAMPSPRKTSKR
ncbi:Fic family protein [Chitinivorax sp. B]|uniref:Fic family protein n=1 Tax=Chitinivorax sp. B TaxID=2502235 RepID=UPI0010F53184|nr:Fic family protein [Chitinivorax sp. B]